MNTPCTTKDSRRADEVSVTTTSPAPDCTLEVLDCGDSAVRVGVLGGDVHQRWRLAHGLSAGLARHELPGLTNLLPTYDAVLVEFDCLRTGHDSVRMAIAEVWAGPTAPMPRPPRTFEIPVVYGGEFGPDLAATAGLLGISTDEVIARHTAAPLLMRCFGAPAGAAMLDGPDFGRPIPRLASPRPHVPAGAVAVAGRQAVVSSRPAPGGWKVLGTTPLALVDATREPLSPYLPGDSFTFVPIDPAEFDACRGVLR